VGQSTIAANLACELYTRKHAVVLVDANDQGTASEWAQAGKFPVRCVSMPIHTTRHVQG
jgi:cellulose biosynthesis protein BcsQ